MSAPLPFLAIWAACRSSSAASHAAGRRSRASSTTGAVGALRLGVVNGLWCAGCCAGLLLALLGLGAMNVGWMAVVGLAVFLGTLGLPQVGLLPWVRKARHLVDVRVDASEFAYESR